MKLKSGLIITLFSFTLFTSAFLLFWVQLFFAKMILPALGGTPSVWSTCLVFFQGVLLAGYSYAHWSTKTLRLQHQVYAQLGLFLVACLWLPIRISTMLGSAPADAPIPWLLSLLSLSVGLPFLTIATIAPLTQHWFTQIKEVQGSSPYFLYSASNLGSLLSLFAYPTLLEARLTLTHQSFAWSIGFIGLWGLVAICGWLVHQEPAIATAPSAPTHPLNPTWRRKLEWVLAAFLPSSLLTGLTTYVTTDIAPVPLIWAVFLGIYLFTFVLVFAPRPLFPHPWIVAATPFLVGMFFMTKIWHIVVFTQATLVLNTVIFFLVTWACHARLSQKKPDPRDLTSFYMLLSLGGVLGGMFNALAAPFIFNEIIEYPLILVFALLALPAIPTPPYRLKWLRAIIPPPQGWCWVGMFLAACLAIISTQTLPDWGKVLVKDRSFFGAYQVVENQLHRYFVHGTTNHGLQNLDPEWRREPTSYFSRTSPLGEAIAILQRRQAKDWAVLGLGAGTLAAYGQPGQNWDFYEIDPLVVQLAKQYFTFLADSPANHQILLGDGRLQLKQSDRQYDLIVMDAFTSDAVPMHLLTIEALQIYLDRLKPNGIIAFNISNRYLDLEPALGRLAAELGLVALERNDTRNSTEDLKRGYASSRWVLMTPQIEVLSELMRDTRWALAESGAALWTDSFSNLLSAVKFRSL